MAIEFDSDNAGLHSHKLKNNRMSFQVTVGANATPADKTHSSDAPSAAYLRTEGKTADADAVEDASSSFTAPADATGIFGVLFDDPSVEKVYSASVSADSGTVALGAQGASVTAEGRVAIDLDSSLDFSSAGATFTITLDYLKSR
jgi:hypothetical protein